MCNLSTFFSYRILKEFPNRFRLPVLEKTTCDNVFPHMELQIDFGTFAFLYVSLDTNKEAFELKLRPIFSSLLLKKECE